MAILLIILGINVIWMSHVLIAHADPEYYKKSRLIACKLGFHVFERSKYKCSFCKKGRKYLRIVKDKAS